MYICIYGIYRFPKRSVSRSLPCYHWIAQLGQVLTTVSCPSAAAHAGYGAVYGGINAAGFSQAPSQKSMGHVLLTYPSGGEVRSGWSLLWIRVVLC